MPRKGPATKRQLVTDPVYGSPLVTALVNKVLRNGKRSLAERIVYGALEGCKDKNAGFRAACAESLGQTYSGDEDKKVLDLLTGLLKDDKDETVKMAASRGLGAMGPRAKEALPTMREIMNKDHIRYLPIKEGDQLLAVISFHDVANAVIKETSFHNRLLKNYIKNWPEEESAK